MQTTAINHADQGCQMSSLQKPAGRAIIVLGMHRSGTSMLTRCIHLLGADIAHQVIAPEAAINRDGFFEDAQIVALNEELLSLLGSCWYDFRPLAREAANTQGLGLWQKKARSHLQKEYAGKRLSVIKDPRMSRLFDFWAPILEHAGLSVDCVHMLRQPEEVAISLQRRNGMPPAYGLLLWCAHIIDVLNTVDSEDSRTTLVYDSFISDTHKNIQLTATMLGSDLADEPDYAGIEAGVGKPQSLVSSANSGALALIPELRDFAVRLYHSLRGKCAGGKLLISRNEIERLDGDYQNLLSRCAIAIATLGALTNELVQLNGELVKIGELHSKAQSVVATRDNQLATVNAELKRVGSELEHAQSVVTERDTQIASLNEQLARYENVWFRRAWRHLRRAFP